MKTSQLLRPKSRRKMCSMLTSALEDLKRSGGMRIEMPSIMPSTPAQM